MSTVTVKKGSLKEVVSERDSEGQGENHEAIAEVKGEHRPGGHGAAGSVEMV